MENQENKPVENGETPQAETDPTKPQVSNPEGSVKAEDSGKAENEKEKTTKKADSAPTNANEEVQASVSSSASASGAAGLAENASATPQIPDPSKMMRAVWFTGFGGTRNIRVSEKPQPSVPSGSEVTVRVKISGLNFIDLMIRMGYMDAANNNNVKPPFILGTELVGEVVAVGPDVTRVKVKDTVFGLPEAGGAWAEYCNLDEKFVFPIAQTFSSIPLEKLACTYSYLVAHLLLQKSGVQEGNTVLLHSAGGGVGFAVLQLAELIGVHVIGIVSEWKHEAVSKHRFRAVFKRNSDYMTEIRKMYPHGVDAVLDPLGGDDCGRGISLLGPGGTYVIYGSVGSVSGESRGLFSIAKNWWTQGQFQVEKVSPMKLFHENTRIGGFNLKKLLQACPAKVEKALNFVWEVMASGEIDPVIDACIHYGDIATHMTKMHERKNIGKIIILPELPHTPVEEGTAAGEVNGTGSVLGQGQTEKDGAAVKPEGSGDAEKKDAK